MLPVQPVKRLCKVFVARSIVLVMILGSMPTASATAGNDGSGVCLQALAEFIVAPHARDPGSYSADEHGGILDCGTHYGCAPLVTSNNPAPGASASSQHLAVTGNARVATRYTGMPKRPPKA